MQSITQIPLAQALSPARRMFRRLAATLTALIVLVTLFSTDAQAQTVACVIASNDGRNGFRTDELTNCRINTSNGEATFVRKQKERSRSYTSRQPLTTRHLEVAQYWLDRSRQLRVPASTNPAGFDPRAFLEAASRATHGFVLVRTKNSGAQAMNLVFITDGVYRSIDFSGTDFRDTPSGFLMTGM